MKIQHPQLGNLVAYHHDSVHSETLELYTSYISMGTDLAVVVPYGTDPATLTVESMELDYMRNVALKPEARYVRQYLHYKGGKYTHLGLVVNLKDKTIMVQYMDTSGKLWLRPYDMFHGKLTLATGEVVDRFQLLSAGGGVNDI